MKTPSSFPYQPTIRKSKELRREEHLPFFKTGLTIVLCAALTLPPSLADSPDRDGDGSSDIWQTQFQAPSLDPDADTDCDGVINGDEELAGTDPLDPQSYLRIESVILVAAEGVVPAHHVLTWQGVAGKTYLVQRNPDLNAAGWEPVGAEILVFLNGQVQTSIPWETEEERFFYRLIVYDRDNDRDGVTASDEFIVGTSDKNPNTSGDRGDNDCLAAVDWLVTNEYGVDPGSKGDNLREVDVAFLQSGSIGQTQINFLVTAAGSGSFHHLTSWNLASALANPSLLATTPPIEGHHPKVKRVPVGAGLEGQPRFLTGTIRGNGDLYLSSRQLNLGGAFTHHSSVGFGSNAGVNVFDYDIAIRTFENNSLISHHHIVTPILAKPAGGGLAEMRIVTWVLDAQTGDLDGLQDSGPLDMPFLNPGTAELRVQIAHLEQNRYVVNYTAGGGGSLSNQFITVNPVDGSVTYDGGGTPGSDLRDESFFSLQQEENAVAGLTATGFVTAVHKDDGRFGLYVWERRVRESFDLERAHHISDDQYDWSPLAPGILIPQPTLTDSTSEQSQQLELAGKAMAVGDFDGDGDPELAIGAPGHDIGDLFNAGVVYIVKGSGAAATMAAQPTHQEWSQKSAGIIGVEEAGDSFGSALAVGDFNNDNIADLAVGVPGEDVEGNSIASAGAVNIILGSATGLGSAGNYIITQEDLGVTSGAFDFFGSELAVGDFDGNGHDDLVISASSRNVGGHPDGGVVYVLRGGASGLSTNNSTLLHQDVVGVQGEVEDNDSFGKALAVGDFDGNGNSDLAVGVPFEDIGSANNAGGAHVFYGSSGSSTGFGARSFLSQGGFDGGGDIRGAVEELDLFGSSLAAGDFDGDGADDLAIGVPGEDEGTIENAGAVNVVYGSAFFGLTTAENLIITQDVFNPTGGGLGNPSEEGDEFGRALVAGHFDDDEYCDLVVGLPSEDLGEIASAGLIVEIRGSENGLSSNQDRQFYQGTSLTGSAETGDLVGEILAAGDFDSDGIMDLLAAVPGEDLDDELSVGGVHVVPGVATGLTSEGEGLWLPQDLHRVRGMVTDLTWEENGIGQGELFTQDSVNEWVHIASVTKCMTLLLLVEAIEAGQVSLWDDVEVSDLAGGFGGSTMKIYEAPSMVPPSTSDLGSAVLDDNGDAISFIQPGDTMPLPLLIHGMMMRSCNRSASAIAQHVAMKVNLDPLDFLNMMKDRAEELGMTSGALEAASLGTLFGHPAGGCVTTPQALITMMREGAKHPLFLLYSSRTIFGHINPDADLCGTDVDDDPKCNNPFGNIQSLGGYPGRLAWKGGNKGFWWGASDANDVPTRPAGIRYATSSQVGIVERAGRRLAIALQQTGASSTDSANMFDYGFRKVFTPDRRGATTYPAPGDIVGPAGPIRVKTFAIDAISSRLCVTAVIDDHEELRLNIWDTSISGSQISPRGFASTSYQLVSGANFAPPKLVDMATIPTTSAIGDFFTATMVEGERLDLRLWRIGENP